MIRPTKVALIVSEGIADLCFNKENRFHGTVPHKSMDWTKEGKGTTDKLSEGQFRSDVRTVKVTSLNCATKMQTAVDCGATGST